MEARLAAIHAAAPGAITLTGRDLGLRELEQAAQGLRHVEISEEALLRVETAHDYAMQAGARRPVYGQNRGVGSNKSVLVDSQAADYGLRLLRSHATTVGAPINETTARAMMIIRANQLATGGSGVHADLLGKLVEAVNLGLTPPIRQRGAIGTGDIAALATTGLCLIGERPWNNGIMPPCDLGQTDALGFMSSSALTLAEAALSSTKLSKRLKTATAIGALSFIASNGNREAYAEAVQQAKPHLGQRQVAQELRAWLGSVNTQPQLQDSYGLRTLPQVHGTAYDQLAELKDAVTVEINAANENPLYRFSRPSVLHNGNFDSTKLAIKLDAMKLALHATAQLSVARLTNLMSPTITNLPPFLADGQQGSSGLLISEYVAQSALAEMRLLAVPDSLGAAVISNGAEEYASFATQAAQHLTGMVIEYETVLACELVAGVRAVRQHDKVLESSPLSQFYDGVATALNTSMADRPIEQDLDIATAYIRELDI